MKWGVLIILAIAIGTAVSVGQNNDEPEVTNTIESTASVETVEKQNDPEVEGAGDPEPAHPVSIPGLQEYQLTGRELSIGRVLADNSLYTRYYLTYKSDDLTISGILNIPTGEGPFPVLFLNHGYIDTSVYTNGRGLKREQDYFARQGFAVLHSDYRCHAQSDCPDADPLAQRFFYAKDVMNAVQAVKTSGDPRLSSTNFGMLGHSMGGGISQVIAVSKPNLVQAIVLYAPVSSSYQDSYERYTTRRPAQVSQITNLYQTAAENPAFWANLSPRNFFDTIQAPIVLFQGTNDADIPMEWSDTTVRLLEEAGKDITYHVYPGQLHEFGGSWTTFMQDSTTFFNRHVK